MHMNRKTAPSGAVFFVEREERLCRNPSTCVGCPTPDGASQLRGCGTVVSSPLVALMRSLLVGCPESLQHACGAVPHGEFVKIPI